MTGCVKLPLVVLQSVAFINHSFSSNQLFCLFKMRCSKVMLGNYSVAEELLYQILVLMAFIYKIMKIKTMETDTQYHVWYPVCTHVNGTNSCTASLQLYVHLCVNIFLQLMTVFFSPSQEKETNIAAAYVYFKQPTAKYALTALQTPPWWDRLMGHGLWE